MASSNPTIRQWDGEAINFVLLAQKIGIHTQLIWHILRQFSYDCNLDTVEQLFAIGEPFLRPWDATTANFVVMSAYLGIHPALIHKILQLHRFSCSLEQVEETLYNAGFMAWRPTWAVNSNNPFFWNQLYSWEGSFLNQFL